ncbi:hypothetical protein BGZ96_005248, partial [Linnemannia gamsii]
LPQRTLSMTSKNTSRPRSHPSLTTLLQTSSPSGAFPFQTTAMTMRSPLCLTTSTTRTRRNSERRVACR